MFYGFLSNINLSTAAFATSADSSSDEGALFDDTGTTSYTAPGEMSVSCDEGC